MTIYSIAYLQTGAARLFGVNLRPTGIAFWTAAEQFLFLKNNRVPRSLEE